MTSNTYLYTTKTSQDRKALPILCTQVTPSKFNSKISVRNNGSHKFRYLCYAKKLLVIPTIFIFSALMFEVSSAYGHVPQIGPDGYLEEGPCRNGLTRDFQFEAVAHIWAIQNFKSCAVVSSKSDTDIRRPNIGVIGKRVRVILTDDKKIIRWRIDITRCGSVLNAEEIK